MKRKLMQQKEEYDLTKIDEYQAAQGKETLSLAEINTKTR